MHAGIWVYSRRYRDLFLSGLVCFIFVVYVFSLFGDILFFCLNVSIFIL